VSKFAVAVCIALLAGLAVGSWLAAHRPEAETAQLADTHSLETNIEERVRLLEQMLLEEQEARIALEDTLSALLEELDTLGVAEQSAAAEQQSRQARQQTAQQEARRRDRSNWAQDYNERRVARMVEGGFTEEEARDLLDKESAASYEAMRAAWEAERSGAAADPFAEQSDPQRILRDSIGDDAYERYLRTQGQPTSVEVTQVLSGSPGAGVGLVTGDRIARYNGERVFSISDLRRLTMQGNPGEDVVIEVERDGVLMQLTLPAGPIGITGTGARVRGMNWWGG
jgi:C-terminal processing protease CtpA/Prc